MRKKKLIEKINKLEKTIKMQSLEIQTLKDELKKQKEKNMNKFMKDFEFALLVEKDKYPGVIIYNLGRREGHWTSVSFNFDCRDNSLPSYKLER